MPDAKSIVRRVIDRAWNNGDLEFLNEVVAPTYIRRFPGGQVSGPDGFKRRIAATRAALPDFHSEIDDIFEESGAGIVRWSATGTQRGANNAVADTGRRVRWSGTTWFRVESGQLVEEQEFYDASDLMQKLKAPDFRTRVVAAG